MSVAPATNIELLVCPLTADQENQITFSGPSAQTAYFDSLNPHKIADSTYQRKDHYISWPEPADAIQQYNYVRYKNSNFQNKWFYAFIDRIEYVNELTSRIYIKTDVYQSWMFEMILEPSFVEREHVLNDGIGLHTMPENLEIGDYRVQEYIPLDLSNTANALICMQVSDFPSSANVDSAPLTMYNGMPSGCYYLVFNKEKITDMRSWIQAYQADQKADAILAIFPIPSSLAQPQTGQSSQIRKLTSSISDNTYVFIQTQEPVKMISINVPYPSGDNFGTYHPRNNKLYTFPYCYFYYNNFTGSTVEYHYEDFYGPLLFTVYGSVTAGGEYKIIPQNILGANGGGNGYGMSLSSMPQGSWNNDTYLNWRALNMDAIAIEASRDALASAIGTVGNLFDLNLAGAAENEINYNSRVQQRMNQQRVASRMPNQARGDTATQSLNFSLNNSGGAFYRMCIREEYARAVDDYFTAFGYQVNEFKIPDITTRTNWNYIKTVGCNIMGKIPQDDILELKRMFDRGVTFWHSPEVIYQYHLDNNPVE